MWLIYRRNIQRDGYKVAKGKNVRPRHGKHAENKCCSCGQVTDPGFLFVMVDGFWVCDYCVDDQEKIEGMLV